MQNNNSLSLSIIFASLVVSGSLIFFGMQMGSGSANPDDLKAAIQDGIEDYVQNAQAEYEDGRPEAAAQPSPTVEGDFSDDDPFIGDPDAPLTIVEWSDYQCPFCARFWSDTLPEIKEKYIDTGKVKLVYRDYPLSSHPQAYDMSLLAECARAQTDDEVYFAIHDKIFADGGRFDETGLTDLAVSLGADAGRLATCIENEDFRDEIYADLADGQAAGITGTPGFLVGNTRISGAQPFSAFEAAIESQL